MRVAAGTAATAGAPAAVISSGSRGVDMVRGLPGQRAITQVACDTASSGSTLLRWLPCVEICGRGHDAPAAPPLDVDEPAELDLAARRRRREGEGRPAEHAAAAVAELRTKPPSPPLRTTRHDAARAVEELDADADPLRGVARGWGPRRARPTLPGSLGGIARVDRRPRGRAELGACGAWRDGEREPQRARERGEERRAPGARAATDGRTRRHRIEHVAAEKPSGSAPIVSVVAGRGQRGGRGGRPSPSRRHSNVTRPRSTNAGCPDRGRRERERPARLAHRARAPWPTSTNPESAAAAERAPRAVRAAQELDLQAHEQLVVAVAGARHRRRGCRCRPGARGVADVDRRPRRRGRGPRPCAAWGARRGRAMQRRDGRAATADGAARGHACPTPRPPRGFGPERSAAVSDVQRLSRTPCRRRPGSRPGCPS